MKKTITGAHFNRQRAPIQTAFQRLNLERDAIVVDAITAVDAGAAVFGGVVEADARSEIVVVPSSRAVQERQDYRIEFD